MNETPDGQHSLEDGELTPKGQKKHRNLMMAGIAIIIAVVLIFVVTSVFLNGA